MCPPNIVDLADRMKIASMRRGAAQAIQATALEVRARWHWWRLEHADRQVVAQTRALGRVSQETRVLREKFVGEHPEHRHLANGGLA